MILKKTQPIKINKSKWSTKPSPYRSPGSNYGQAASSFIVLLRLSPPQSLSKPLSTALPPNLAHNCINNGGFMVSRHRLPGRCWKHPRSVVLFGSWRVNQKSVRVGPIQPRDSSLNNVFYRLPETLKRQLRHQKQALRHVLCGSQCLECVFGIQIGL